MNATPLDLGAEARRDHDRAAALLDWATRAAGMGDPVSASAYAIQAARHAERAQCFTEAAIGALEALVRAGMA